jgi:hypothetical protein
VADDSSKSKSRRIDSEPLTPLYPDEERTAEFIPWRTTRPHEGEAVRWECVDGRWVALSIGRGASLGSVLVTDSAGRCETLDSYERALELAKRWRR